jgi:uncharacterized membrane protein YvbJ
MVYCSKCGTKNDDTAEYCVKCGAKLKVSKDKSLEKRIEEGAEKFGRHAEEECFGLPHSGLMFGLVGIIIILVGILSLAGIEYWRSFWAIIIIIFGVLILGGALYTLTRKR